MSIINASAVPLDAGQNNFFICFSALDAAVVATVSIDGWAAVPLILTEVRFRLHVGMSLTLVIEVVTAQDRFTVPLNPFVPTTLIVPVFPVVAPGVTVIDFVSSEPPVKLGCAVMLSATLVVAFNVPEVPVMVTVAGLDMTTDEVLAASVSTCVPTADPAAKEAVTPPGRPLAARVTLPEKPPTAVTVIVLVPLLPWATETLVGDADSVKLGAVIVYVAEAIALLLYPPAAAMASMVSVEETAMGLELE